MNPSAALYLNSIESIKIGSGQQWVLWLNTFPDTIAYHRSTVINEYSLIIVTGFDIFN